MNKDSSAKKILKNSKQKRAKKYESYAEANLGRIKSLLSNHINNSSDLKIAIIDFLEGLIEGKEVSLQLPANFDVGLASQILNSMSLWLGNTQESFKNQQFLKKNLDSK